MAQGQKLVIVESPTKAQTIRKYLGKEFRVEASVGHIRDLPADASEIPAKFKKKKWARLGVDVENDFSPIYVVPKEKKKVITELKKALKDADELYIATDEDREGESIGWHLLDVLKPKVPTHRMVFHEITPEAIKAALENPRAIDEHLVEAQETRRILDRLVGYTVSPLLWKKVKPRLSAGRVQSVAVRLLVQRERERMRFVSGSYWDVAATLNKSNISFNANLATVDGTRIASGRDFDENTGQIIEGRNVLLLEQERAESIREQLDRSDLRVASVERKESKRRPYPPFTTSTLQQEANRKLGFPASRTMGVAQKLYERGLITYMRTDSVNLSDQAVSAARGLVERRYGSDYLSPKPRRFATKAKGAQEAHEAIRPAGTEMPTVDEARLRGDEAKLYELIWKRTVSTQMADAVIAMTAVHFEAKLPETGETVALRSSGKEIVFPGFFRAYVEGSDDPEEALDDQGKLLPAVDEDERLPVGEAKANGHQTRPPARYTEATLVKALESEGIGRPSTYASIIGTIQARRYASTVARALVPSFTAIAVTNLLEEVLPEVVDYEFTAAMERRLDEIAEGGDAGDYLRTFYQSHLIEKVEAGEQLKAEDVCRLQYKSIEPHEIRVGRYGPYVRYEKANGEPGSASLPEDLPPADVDAAFLDTLLQRAEKADEPIATMPETGLPIFLKSGRYGPYLEVEPTDEGGKPSRVSVPKEFNVDTLTPEQAIALAGLPRLVGAHPDTGNEIRAGIGRYGAYVLHDGVYASLTKSDDVLAVGLERAVELIANKKTRGRQTAEPLRELGAHPDDGKPVVILDGRYGPYVKHLKVNASLPKGTEVEALTMEEAVDLLAARAAAPKKKRAPRKKK